MRTRLGTKHCGKLSEKQFVCSVLVRWLKHHVFYNMSQRLDLRPKIEHLYGTRMLFLALQVSSRHQMCLVLTYCTYQTTQTV